MVRRIVKLESYRDSHYLNMPIVVCRQFPVSSGIKVANTREIPIDLAIQVLHTCNYVTNAILVDYSFLILIINNMFLFFHNTLNHFNLQAPNLPKLYNTRQKSCQNLHHADDEICKISKRGQKVDLVSYKVAYHPSVYYRPKHRL